LLEIVFRLRQSSLNSLIVGLRSTSNL